MIKKIVLILGFYPILIFSQGNLNEIYRQFSLAKIYENQGSLDSALITYDLGFNHLDFKNSLYLNRAKKVAIKVKDHRRINFYDSILKSNLQSVDSNLIKVVDSLSVIDQQIRSNKILRASKYVNRHLNDEHYTSKFINSKVLLDSAKKTDSLIGYKIISLIEENGYLGEKLVGYNKSLYVHRMLLHFDLDSNSRILKPYLDKALNEGDILPLQYAQIIDRHYRPYNSRYYWIWGYSNREKVNLDIEEIIKRREEIGIYYSSFYFKKRRKLWVLYNVIK